MGLDGGIKLVDYFETEFRRVENCVSTVLHTFGVLYTALMFQEKNFTQNFIAMRLSSASMVVVRWKYLLLTRLRVGMDLIHTQLASYLDAQRGHDQVVPLLP